VRDSCEEGDDYAEGYAAGEKNQRSDLWRLELVERDAGTTIAYALLLRRYHMHKNQLVNYISRKKRGISSTTSRRYQ
jgi:hypothetical protein